MSGEPPGFSFCQWVALGCSSLSPFFAADTPVVPAHTLHIHITNDSTVIIVMLLLLLTHLSTTCF